MIYWLYYDSSQVHQSINQPEVQSKWYNSTVRNHSLFNKMKNYSLFYALMNGFPSFLKNATLSYHFIQNNVSDRVESPASSQLLQKHSQRAVQNPRRLPIQRILADLVSHQTAKFPLTFIADVPSDADRGDPPRLGDDNERQLAAQGAITQDVLRNLRGFSASRGAMNKDHRVFGHGADDGLAKCGDREILVEIDDAADVEIAFVFLQSRSRASLFLLHHGANLSRRPAIWTLMVNPVTKICVKIRFEREKSLWKFSRKFENCTMGSLPRMKKV